MDLQILKDLLGPRRLMAAALLTKHPDDYYLWVVLYQKTNGEFVCHTYNTQSNGFTNGYYTDEEDSAWGAFRKRVEMLHD